MFANLMKGFTKSEELKVFKDKISYFCTPKGARDIEEAFKLVPNKTMVAKL